MSALFPSCEERQRIEAILSKSLAEADRQVVAGPVGPSFSLPAFRAELAHYNFGRSLALEDILRWTINSLTCGLVHVTHPRYFGLFNPTPTFPALCADRIVAAFNPQLATFTTSPAAVELEAHVIRAVAQRAGMPDEARGHFTTGGSEANYTALMLALTRAEPGFSAVGARAFSGQPVFYVSRDSHLAWIKIAHQAGIGRHAVRLVPTDGSGRLSMLCLQSMIEADRAEGAIPVLIGATAGTTNAGMIDPLHECVRLAAANGLWCHVDAAWAGALIACRDAMRHLSGIEHADSVTIDAHKWFATTMGCGMFMTRHPDWLAKVFQVANTYMPSNDVDADPYVSTQQWSRRFLGLRLFLSLAAAGWDGYAAHVRHALCLSDLLRCELTDAGWMVVNDSPAGVVCAVPPNPESVRTVVSQVVASGQSWVSAAMFEGRAVMRACVTSGLTTEEDVRSVVAALKVCACSLGEA